MPKAIFYLLRGGNNPKSETLNPKLYILSTEGEL